MEILTDPPQIGTHNMGFSAQFPAKKGPGNLTPNKSIGVMGRFDSPEFGPVVVALRLFLAGHFCSLPLPTCALPTHGFDTIQGHDESDELS